MCAVAGRSEALPDPERFAQAQRRQVGVTGFDVIGRHPVGLVPNPDVAGSGCIPVEGRPGWSSRRSGVRGTTSWLLAPFQGHGIGTCSRAAVLELAFTHLRAESAKSWVLDDNRASVAVSTKLGYRLIDRHDITEHGCRFTEGVYQLERDVWLESPVRRQHLPAITGVERLVELLDR
jgi:GNAT superfamily N-acetyltransferase